MYGHCAKRLAAVESRTCLPGTRSIVGIVLREEQSLSGGEMLRQVRLPRRFVSVCNVIITRFALIFVSLLKSGETAN